MMDNQGRAVVVLFGGDPRRDERQKRLPHQFLSTLHDALLKTVGGLAGVDVLVARDAGDEFRLGAARWQLDSLAARIETAIAYSFSRGYSRVLLLAGDIVDVRREDIARALQALDGSAGRAVIGLSGDGGFYVAGFSQSPALDWSSLLRDRQNAGPALSEALRACGFVVTHLRAVDDIDTRDDARRLVRLRNLSRSFLRLVARLASMIQRLPGIAPLPHGRRDAALAFSSTFRGPPGSRSPL